MTQLDYSNTPKQRLSTLARFGIALLCITMATLLTSLFYDVFQGAPFMLYFPAIILSTWYGGFRVGIFASLLSAIVVHYLFHIPRFALALDVISLAQVTVFIGVTTLITAFYESRRKLAETLQRQEEWLRVTLTSIGDAVIATDKAGCITFINPIAVKLTGWAADEALGKSIYVVFRIISEENRKPVEVPIMKALEKGMIVGLANHTLLISKGGEEIPISDSAAPIYNVSGEVIGAILVFRDMTEARLHEVALATSEARYRDLVESANDIIYTLDNQQNITSINAAGEKLTGYKREELLNTSAGRLIAPEYLPMMREMLSRKVDGEQQTIYEVELIGKNVQRLAVEINSRLIYEDGKPVGVYGIGRDVTERKRAERRTQSLQEVTEAFSETLTLEEVAEVIVTKGVAALQAQSLWMALLDATGKQLQIFSHHAVQAETVEAYENVPLSANTLLAETAREGKAIWLRTAEEFFARYPDSINVMNRHGDQATASLPIISDKRLIGSIVIGFPDPQTFDERERIFITALVQQCSQAIHRARLYQQALEAAAYEERQRLARELHDAVSQTLFSATTIAGVLPQLWERNPQRAIEQLEQMVVLNRAAMAEMRTLLLELRPEAIVRTTLPNLLTQLAEALQGRRRITISVSIEGEEIMLPPDVHVAVYRVAQESLNNAVKHSKATTISVRFLRSSSEVTLEVKDNGRGFDVSRTTPGFGLGTMQERADKLNARISIQSVAGEGTTVILRWNGESTPPVGRTLI